MQSNKYLNMTDAAVISAICPFSYYLTLSKTALGVAIERVALCSAAICLSIIDLPFQMPLNLFIMTLLRMTEILSGRGQMSIFLGRHVLNTFSNKKLSTELYRFHCKSVIKHLMTCFENVDVRISIPRGS